MEQHERAVKPSCAHCIEDSRHPDCTHKLNPDMGKNYCHLCSSYLSWEEVEEVKKREAKHVDSKECEHKWIKAQDNNCDTYKLCLKCHKEIEVDCSKRPAKDRSDSLTVPKDNQLVELDENELLRKWCDECKGIDKDVIRHIIHYQVMPLINSLTVPKKRLSVEEIESIIENNYCVACEIRTAKGRLVNGRLIAKQLHQRIYGSEES